MVSNGQYNDNIRMVYEDLLCMGLQRITCKDIHTLGAEFCMFFVIPHKSGITVH